MTAGSPIGRERSARAGVLVAVVGVGGAGKSSGVKAASERLAAEGIDAATFHARSEFATLARSALGRADDPLTPEDGLLLTAFERVRELRYELEPIRHGFDVVLADRYWHCLIARALAEGIADATTAKMTALGGLAPEPDAILWLDVDPAIAIERIGARGTWRADELFGQRLRDAYSQLATTHRFQRVDASADATVVRDRIVQHVHRALAAADGRVSHGA